jgi:hypothetical protein
MVWLLSFDHAKGAAERCTRCRVVTNVAARADIGVDEKRGARVPTIMEGEASDRAAAIT